MIHAIAFIETDTGKIVNLQFPQGELVSEGLRNEGAIRVVHVNDDNIPNQNCKNYEYFITCFCYNQTTRTFAEVGKAPNDYATWSFENNAWEWDAELVLKDIRRARNNRLFVSDWTVGLDSPLSDAQKEEALTYRTTLRNFPSPLSNPPNVESVTWPTPPSFLA